MTAMTVSAQRLDNDSNDSLGTKGDTETMTAVKI